jgi:Heterokaryon incompatibility protein (HET)
MEFIKSWLCEDDRFQDDLDRSLEDFWKPVQHGIDLQLLAGASDSGAQKFRLPTRLVDVGNRDDPYVRICLSSEISKNNSHLKDHHRRLDLRYMALSHSWGALEFLKLTESELPSWIEHGISIDALPPTFRDAVSVVRRVGLRFLWIDSLCIIQDSREDWRRSAAQMKDIYSNAACVIAAVASWTSSESFFARQSPLAANPCLLGVRGHLVSVNGNAENSFSGIYALPPLKYTSDSWEDVRLSRLRSRAWCYQEEQLAKKVVYFGDHQVLLSEHGPSGAVLRTLRQVQWQSKKETSEDLFPNPIDPPIFKVTRLILQQAISSLTISHSLADWRRRWRFPRADQMADLSKEQINRINRFDLNQHVESVSELLTSRWWAVVTQYSDRFLTMEEDKLQALSGIALRYQSAALFQGVKVHYVAGLWADGESYLATGLLWYVSRHSREPRPENNRAPSWSWASVDGRVRNDSLSGCCSADHTGISILQYSVEGPDVIEGTQMEFPTGLCSGGFVVVRGMIQKANWDVTPGDNKSYYVQEPGKNLWTYNTTGLKKFAPFSSDPMSGPEAYPLFSESAIRVGYFLPDAREGAPKEIFCLRIVVKPKSRAEQENFSVPWATRGLALTTTGHAPNEFTRIGYFELDKTLGNLRFPNKFSRPFDRNPAFRSPGPNIDVTDFFGGCQEQEIVIR